MNITNFSFNELTKTDTAYNNTPNDLNIIKNLIRIGELLQTIRNELHLPIIVNSAYRSNEVNEAVGGAHNSYHCKRTCC